MSHTPERPDQALEAAMITLKNIERDVEYQVLSNETGPLTLDQLPSSSREDKVLAAMSSVGWPTYSEDIPPRKPKRFHTDIEFLQALRPLDEDGPQFVSWSFFYKLLHEEPNKLRDSSPADIVYSNLSSSMPVLLRANAAFPELFDALRVSLREMSIEYDDGADEDHVYEELLKEENKPVLSGMRTAYGLMTRLVKQDDVARHRDLLRKQGMNLKDTVPDEYSVNPDMLVLYSNQYSL